MRRRQGTPGINKGRHEKREIRACEDKRTGNLERRIITRKTPTFFILGFGFWLCSLFFYILLFCFNSNCFTRFYLQQETGERVCLMIEQGTDNKQHWIIFHIYIITFCAFAKKQNHRPVKKKSGTEKDIPFCNMASVK
jgi:hypothetical protein